MGFYYQLKQSIKGVIKANGVQAITGDILQGALLAMVNSLGKNSTFGGVITPASPDPDADENVFYIAAQTGVYTSFDNKEITVPGIYIFTTEGDSIQWTVTPVLQFTDATGDDDNKVMTQKGVTAAIKIETTRATNAEKLLQNAVTKLQQDLGTETTRATNREDEIAQSVAKETTRATEREDEIAQSVATETERAEGAENALTQRVNNTYTKAETDEQIAAVAGRVYKTKGSVQNAAALLALTNVEVGDTYNVIEAGTIDGKPFIAGSNLVATKDGLGNQPNMWDPLGGTFDTTLFLEKSDAAKTYATIVDLDKEVARAKGEEKKNADGLTAEITRAKGREDELAGGAALRPLFEAIPYVRWNSDTKMYDIYKAAGGISVTEQEMLAIYNGGNLVNGYKMASNQVKAIITFVDNYQSLENVYISSSGGTQYIGGAYVALKNPAISVNGNLLKIGCNIYCSDSTNISKNKVLESIKLKVYKTKQITITLAGCPKLDYISLRYIPDNVQGSSYDNITTITVDALPYSLLTGTATPEQYGATGHTQEEWAQIQTDSTAKGITYTQALERSEATRFRRALPEPTRVEGNEIVAATGKALHRVGSDVYFDRATLLSGETVSDFVEVDREEALAIIEAKEADEAAKYQPMEGAAE